MDDFQNIIHFLQLYNNVIILGAGGVGKSYNINKIVEYYESNQKIVVVTAPTGISSININGVTINSLLKFGDTNSIEEYNVYMNEIYAKNNPEKINNLLKKMREKISSIDLLVIDEISMISAEKWELIDFLLTKFEFKGKIILAGDIFQLKPIFKESKYLQNEHIDERLFFESPTWRMYKFIPYVLEKIYRTDNKEFIKTLHNVRVGEYNTSDKDYLYNMTNNYKVYNQNPTILASTNKYVFNYNKQKLDDIREELCVQEYKVTYKRMEYVTKYKNDIKKFINGYLNIDKQLHLKIGALVVFIVNDKDNRFVNGEKGIVKDIQENIIEIEKEDGTRLEIKRYKFPYYDYDETGFVNIADIKQFPIKLAFALTIHKSQSLTMDNIIINFENMFASGQFYVALSRGKNPYNIAIEFKKLSSFMFEYDYKKFIGVEQKLIDFNNRAKKMFENYLKKSKKRHYSHQMNTK